MFLLIIIIFIALWIYYRPKVKSGDYYSQHPELNTSVSFISKIDKCNAFWEYARNTVRSFQYHNRTVFIQMMDGAEVSGRLEDMHVSFQMFQRGLFQCTVKSSGQKVTIINGGRAHSASTYVAMFEILSHAQKVNGLGDFKAYKSKNNLTNGIKGFLGVNVEKNSYLDTSTMSTPTLTIKCPDCGAIINDSTKPCPNCYCPPKDFIINE